MSTTNGTAYDDFIAALPAERQQAAAQVWQLVRQTVPAGYTEHVGPKYLEFRAGTEMAIGLTNQKGHLSLHLVPMYLLPALRERLTAAAPKLKMGSGCVNFKKVEELPLDTLAEVIAATSLADYLVARNAPRKKG